MQRSEKELARIREAYERRKESVPASLYSLFNPSAIFLNQQRERSLIDTLRGNGFEHLSEMRILDIGCGTGNVLREFVRYGANPENLHGIDLLHDRIDTAMKISPNIHFKCGNAETLPYDNSSFDIIILFTVLTSILDSGMKKAIASEALRILKPEGIILYYDYLYDNPKNPDVRGIKKSEIRRLFEGSPIDLKRITLAPPVARALAPYAWSVCYLLEKLKILNTHYMGVIKKGDKGSDEKQTPRVHESLNTKR
jgi:ubiquinone/menaquinone biosynthesis C-methylase UbiE